MPNFIESLKQDCAKQPIRLDHYMALCLNRPKQGYYQSRDMFGKKGDFTTAPEISQLFGEIIIAWILWHWQEMKMEKFALVEAGAGRGSLMLDLLRHGEKICPNFIKAAEIHLIETSPYLRKIQQERLHSYAPTFHETIDTLPEKKIIFLANEFLDALPVRQLYRQGEDWLETYITYNQEKSDLDFCYQKISLPLPVPVPQLKKQDGDWLEFSPQAIHFSQQLANHLSQFQGIALLIDYGTTSPITKQPSFQALSKHTYVDSLADPGNADLTAHVNFSVLDYIFQSYPLKIAFMTQEQFLVNFGIKARAKILCHQNPTRKNDINQALERLTDKNEMGELFKFMIITNVKKQP